MQISKGLLDYHGRPWLLEQLERLKKTGTTRTLIVLGYRANEYLEQIPSLISEMGKTVLINHQPEFGPFSSIQTGIRLARACAPDEEPRPIFILPIDVPCPQMATWEVLEEELRVSVDVVLPTLDGTTGGHPVLLSAYFQNILLDLLPSHPDARLDFQIKQLGPEGVKKAAVLDPEIKMNLNTPNDWERFAQI